MKVKELAETFLKQLVNKDIYLDSEVKYKDQNGNEYSCGSVREVMEQIGCLIEPIEDLPIGHYVILDKKTRKPLSSYIYEFSMKPITIKEKML